VQKRTLFSILAEMPWWFSLLIAGLIYTIGALFNPLIGAAAAFPFVLVAAYVAYLRIKRGPTADFPVMIKALRSASPEDMRDMLAEAFKRQRFEVTNGKDGDLELQRNGYVTLVRFRRWRAQSTNPHAIQELLAAMKARQADHAMYITAGAVPEATQAAADAASITLLDGVALANLVIRTRGARKAVSRSAGEAAKA
jgi:restriction system protein